MIFIVMIGELRQLSYDCAQFCLICMARQLSIVSNRRRAGAPGCLP